MKITILGTGALGIAMTKALAKIKDAKIVMWTKFEDEKNLLISTRENKNLLPGVKLAGDITITTDLKYAMEGSTLVINCLPFAAIRSTAEALKGIYDGQYICSTTKGIDVDTLETTTQILSNALNTDKICALSGPSFAIEIAENKPISFILAGKDEATLNEVYSAISSDSIFIEKSLDNVGTEICGAVKNAVAIGSGILNGMNSADSTKAAYLSRGMKDMIKIIESLGGNRDTVYTYAGVGDLI